MATTTLSIQLYWASLKNEIDAETWKAGKCYITEDKAEERAEAQTGNDTLDINYCYRKIEQGIMQLQDIAHKFFVGFNRNAAASTDNYAGSTDWSKVENGDTIKVLYSGEYATAIVTEVASTFAASKISVSGALAAVPPNGMTFVDIEIDASYNVVSSSTSTSASSDNKLNNGVSYWSISLKFGDRQNVDASLLATELHKYVVLNVLQEWCKIANPTLTNEYISRQQAEEVRIKSIMYRKEEPNWAE